MLARARENTAGQSSITLFRANARGALPFQKARFDIVLIRLAPFGPADTPKIRCKID